MSKENGNFDVKAILQKAQSIAEKHFDKVNASLKFSVDQNTEGPEDWIIALYVKQEDSNKSVYVTALFPNIDPLLKKLEAELEDLYPVEEISPEARQ